MRRAGESPAEAGSPPIHRAAMPPGALTRRRVMTILGAIAGVPLLGAIDRPNGAVALHRWNGTSLGSPSRLMICHPDRATAEKIVADCVAEITRLERVFALYRPDSELARLNRDGRLANPSFDLLTLLSQGQRLSALSGGAFDVTVQPLWTLYAAHFFGAASPPADGPPPRAIEHARSLVDWRDMDVTPRQVALLRRQMGVTLNGMAQGYVTDRVVDILRDNGCDQVLADMGCSELRASGRRSDGRPWRVGLADPRQPENVAATFDLCDHALCTSGGYGTKFEATGRFHHLFDPASGASANHCIAVSVLAPRAMIADALSTALYVVPAQNRPRLLEAFPGVSALVTQPDGSVHSLPG
jgi:thiamine biosynthesis lipoprotein